MSTDSKTFNFEFAQGVSPETYSEALTLGDIATMLKTPGTKKNEKSYLPGELKDHYRKSVNVISRSVITLDLDGALEGGFEALCGFLSDFYYFWHTTYSHSEEKHSYRFLVPLAEAVTPGQYGDMVRQIIAANPKASIDVASAKPAQIMFTPASKDPFSYDYGVHEGDLLDALRLFGASSSGEAIIPLGRTDKKKDPYSLQGPIGVFNRTYRDLHDLIAEFDLPYTYDPLTGRYRYDGSSPDSTPGMRELDERPGLYYSWHAKDPAAGYAQNAFDLVRIHKFGDADKSYNGPVNRAPSYQNCKEFLDYHEGYNARLALAASGVPDKALGVTSEVLDDVEGSLSNVEWVSQLQVDKKTGAIMNTVDNLDLIFSNDPNFQGLGVCDRGAYYTWDKNPDPLTPVKPPKFQRADYSRIRLLLMKKYKIPNMPMGDVEMMVDSYVDKNHFDPIQRYLDALEWDGVPRLETCLPGVEDNEYTRMVARRTLIAAVARAYEPGVKADQTLILAGVGGLGKSGWIERMSKGFWTKLGNIDRKDTLINAGKAWIVLSDESASISNADFNELKDFLTSPMDSYRPPYERDSIDFERRWVIWGTTNDPLILRERDGNRRFLIVDCVREIDFEDYNDDYVNQVWAEAVHAYKSGETHVLSRHEYALAEEVRRQHTSTDDLTDRIEAALSITVPEDWHSVMPAVRTSQMGQWYAGIGVDGKTGPGDLPREFITLREVWTEVECRPVSELGFKEQSRIRDALHNLTLRGVLTPSKTKIRLPFQGRQRVYYVNHDKLTD